MDAAKQPVPFALPEPQGIPIARILRTLRRHALLIGALAVVGSVGAYALARTMPKRYTASSLIAVEGDRFAIPELQGALRADSASDPMPFVRTEMQALASRDLMQAVVDRLHLVDNPEFNSDLRMPTLMQKMKAAFQSLLPDSVEMRSQLGPNDGVVRAALDKLTIFQDNRSLAIEVSFTSEDPQLSSDAVTVLIDEYIAAKGRRRTAANLGANQAMLARIEQVRLDVATIEKEMLDLRSSNEIVLLRAGSIGQQQIEELATAAARASVERSQLEMAYERTTSQVELGASDALASVLTSPTIVQMREQEAAGVKRVAELLSHYGASYPGVRSAEAELASIRSQIVGETRRIVSSLGTQLRVAQAHEAEVAQQLDDARKIAVKSENARARLEQLQQEVTSRRGLYQTLLERAQQTVNRPADVQTPDVHVMTTATPPGAPSSPNMKLAGGLGGVAGAILGCLFALGRLRILGRTMARGELAANTGVSVVAAFPDGFRGRGKDTLPRRVLVAPRGSEAQAMRALRNRIRRLGRAATPRLVMVTSLADRDDGLQIASALARVVAGDGERVLLLDANLRNPGVLKLLGAPAGDFVADAADWRDQVVADADTWLDILAFKQSPADALERLSSTVFQNVLVEAAAQYDLVVLVAPSASSQEAQALAQRVDAVLLVVDDEPAREAAQQTTDRLGLLSRRSLGLVMVGS